MAACVKHPFDDAVGQCRSCAEPFCEECLVYVHGPNRPPLCVPCALVAAGVRRLSAAERRMHRARQRERAQKALVTTARPGPHTAETDASDFGPLSARGRALLEARNGHDADAVTNAVTTPTPTDHGNGVNGAEVSRRRRFFGLF